MCGTWLRLTVNPSWNGYTELITATEQNCQTSMVLTLPFVNLQPTSVDAIYTILTYAVAEYQRQGQQTCVLMF